MRFLARVPDHGAKFPLIEGAAISAGNAKLEKRRAGRIEDDGDGDEREDGQQKQQGKDGDANVQSPL
jgi:hypothetical protein